MKVRILLLWLDSDGTLKEKVKWAQVPRGSADVSMCRKTVRICKHCLLTRRHVAIFNSRVVAASALDKARTNHEVYFTLVVFLRKKARVLLYPSD